MVAELRCGHPVTHSIAINLHYCADYCVGLCKKHHTVRMCLCMGPTSEYVGRDQTLVDLDTLLILAVLGARRLVRGKHVGHAEGSSDDKHTESEWLHGFFYWWEWRVLETITQ